MRQDGSASSGAAATPRATVGPAHALRSISSHRSPSTFQNPQEWDKWIRRLERFCLASNLNASSEEHQDNTLIYCMGDEVDDILHGLDLTDAKHGTYTEVCDAFQGFFENVESFVTSL